MEECCAPADVDVNTSAVASILIGIVDGLMLQWLLEPTVIVSGDELLHALQEATRLIGEDNLAQ